MTDLRKDVEEAEKQSASLHIDKDLEERLLIELEGQRTFENTFLAPLISVIAFSWSVFQLYVSYFPVNSTIIRSVHLAFAIFLTFLIYPIKKKQKYLEKVFWYDYLLAIIGMIGAAYIAIDFTGLANRAGDYLLRDIAIGIIFIVILLEAGRRAIGIALSLVAIAFLLYDKLGEHLPDLIAHKNVPLEKLIGQIYLTTEGIFGVPLGVSASFVFLFVLFGALLERAGAGEYFIKLAYALLGRYVGGPAKAAVVASGLTGIISGSSTANVVTTGVFTIPLMKKAGFPPEKAAAVEVAASTNGQLMPPVMGAAAFIIAEFLGLSYMDVVISAAIPAIVSYIGLLYIVHLEAKKLGLRGEDPSKLPPKLKTFISGLHYFIPVVYLLYVLMILRQSPQMSAFSAIWVMMVLMIIQPIFQKIIAKQPLNKRDFIQGFIDIYHGMVTGARNMIPIALATAIAGIVVGSITITGIGQVLVDVVDTISQGNIFIILFLTAIISLILGMGLPTTANYIVVSSLAAPVILQLAQANGFLIPALAAHLFVFYFGILADDTPPVGIAAYAASAIAKSNPIKTGVQGFSYDIRTAILPFAFFFNTELLLISSVNSWDLTEVTFIKNPLKIAFIFGMALMGMLSFSSAVQGFLLKKLNIIQRLLFLFATFLFLVPNLAHRYFDMPSEYLSFVIGMAIWALIYFWQKATIPESFLLKSPLGSRDKE
ncbi:TRAP transporter, 4TM/12TM fusion protein [Thermodesulfatator indicus DSM 15286]|uniref:TRAP transporter, 4TM/12TM fusion protein n=1 Tax=Thermodesulfatator indicus (strain DSM 15286 / JCM 11887 / CIR29812) TaxID=667014 RepID=F8A890_THEID|nr:TRAP transporter permease [Thermodesulfatator indicus]AEH44541.1 TRAP transporter, 4TM/12TM fusion protein [Thermodesulfatator indicus DSM 15286]